MAATPSSELFELLAIPSISSEPAHAPDLRRAAEWIARQLAFAGGRVVETGGHPAVLAEWLGAPGAPTILVYGHYDVQPPGDLDAWTTPPFEPSVRDGRIYARGATDDKCPVFVALETARRLFEQGCALPLNVRFLIEGEEEIGSPSLGPFLAANRDALACDLVVSADGAMWRPSEPSIAVAAKGLLALELVVDGPATDLHSGRHGGAVLNPNHALATIVASFHEADGRVTVPGFYDDVLPAVVDVPFDEDEYRREVGVPELHGEPGFSTLERLWARPTLEVDELRGGGAFTVIPSRASAYVTCRLVPDQEPQRVFDAVAAHVAAVAPAAVRTRVELLPGAVPAYSISEDGPAVLAGVAALRSVYPASEPLLVRIGGTLPAATLFERELGAKTLLFSFSIGDEQLHAPNEFFRLPRIEEGIAAWTELWRLLPGSLRKRSHASRPSRRSRAARRGSCP
jgi:acetylornithine deacetylase/succinyl-diaminopimelate desuccinylase-like protein